MMSGDEWHFIRERAFGELGADVFHNSFRSFELRVKMEYRWQHSEFPCPHEEQVHLSEHQRSVRHLFL